MPDYRRYFVPGGTFFFSLVTARRAPLFCSAEACRLLGNVMRQEREHAPFATVAVVLLPDHLHAIWTLPVGDADYPGRWQAIKARFYFDVVGDAWRRTISNGRLSAPTSARNLATALHGTHDS